MQHFEWRTISHSMSVKRFNSRPKLSFLNIRGFNHVVVDIHSCRVDVLFDTRVFASAAHELVCEASFGTKKLSVHWKYAFAGIRAIKEFLQKTAFTF